MGVKLHEESLRRSVGLQNTAASVTDSGVTKTLVTKTLQDQFEVLESRHRLLQRWAHTQIVSQRRHPVFENYTAFIFTLYTYSPDFRELLNIC